MTGDLTDDRQGGFREGSGCVDQIFTLKQIREKAQDEKTYILYGFHRFGKGIQ